MKIGILGAGRMGSALGLGWAAAGHDVFFGARDPERARTAARLAKPGARGGDLDEAADFGEVVLYTVRNVWPSQVLRSPRSLDGKILIDCNNSEILGVDVPDPRPGSHFLAATPSLAEKLAADAPSARVVKAFNTMSSLLIGLGRDALAPERVSVFLCSDDAPAKAVVARLAEELGFVAVDSGGLERAQLVEALADFVRFQIIDMNAGPYATLSLRRRDEEAR